MDCLMPAHICGPSMPVLLEQNIYERLEDVRKHFSNRIAIKTPNCRVSYNELVEKSHGLAVSLLGLGVETGHRVAINLGNCAQYAVISYACFKIGAIVVPLNPAYTSDQIISALNHICASCFITSTEISLPYKQPKSTSTLLKSLCDLSGSISAAKLPGLRHIVMVQNSSCQQSPTQVESAQFKTYEDLLSSGMNKPCVFPHQNENTTVATIQFTSGTTSNPRGVCLSHRHILNNAFLVGKGMGLTERDIICCPPPLYHCFGLVLGLITAMTYGACVVLPSEAFDAQAVIKSISEDRPTALYGVPTMFLSELDLLGTLKGHDFAHLRTGVTGGSPIPPSLRLKLHERMNLSDLASCYGLTESSPIVCMTMQSDSLEQKLHTVGRALPHTSIRIAPRDDPTKTLHHNEKGELLISGYCVMSGYWNDEECNSRTLIKDEEGKIWLRSGDEAMIDREGYVRITGRIKDIIIRGGENIYPPEIENVLLQHPKIANASVVGLSDERYGEAVASFVVVKDGIVPRGRIHMIGNDHAKESIGSVWYSIDEEEVREWVRARLSRMVVPRHVFWTDKMPLTASGKIEKYKLRSLGESLLRTGEVH